MFEHFKGKYEVELKFRLESLDLFRERLMVMNPEVLFEKNTESDCYFESEHPSLESQRKSLCIREIQPVNVKLWIVKGPGKDQCEAVEINDINIAHSMLNTLNYRPSLSVQKERSIYFLNEFHITLDNLKGVGEFTEIAVMTNDESKLDYYREQLMTLALQLDLTAEQIEHRSYREISNR